MGFVMKNKSKLKKFIIISILLFSLIGGTVVLATTNYHTRVFLTNSIVSLKDMYTSITNPKKAEELSKEREFLKDLNDGKDVNPDKLSYEKPEWLVDKERRKANRDSMIKEGVDLAGLVQQCERWDENGQMILVWYIDECIPSEEELKLRYTESEYAMGKAITNDMAEFNQYKEKVDNKIKSMVEGEILNNNHQHATVMVKNGQIINLHADGQVKQNNQIKTFNINNNEIVYQENR